MGIKWTSLFVFIVLLADCIYIIIHTNMDEERTHIACFAVVKQQQRQRHRNVHNMQLFHERMNSKWLEQNKYVECDGVH